ncbi:4'-phosphopantetheinyl transferase family protein [Ostreibacterium oceani]|uniref:4'-phosphopantetheinyl transferase superfamily protein n=1 Tax=Ostreibacterium oceani TaxID=2654998 RepID=A0A6N7ETW7_9GAMM|nr:4'-phosphopantetheinyl transferase superfamily protein [Ostreibacterium oceani]MPV85403.1 4'-phosphopantetheinyl transferase superfamily protein [Ostreibacterium oceani]
MIHQTKPFAEKNPTPDATRQAIAGTDNQQKRQPQGALHLYYSQRITTEEIASEKALSPWLSCLSHSDQQRASTMPNPTRKATFVSGRVLLATALKSLVGSSHYQLHYHALGKPLLKQPEGIQFSLSHSADALFLLISTSNQPCGMDVEQYRARETQRLIDKFFSPSMQHEIQHSSDPLSLFYQRWTQREASIKQQGRSVFSKNEANHINNRHMHDDDLPQYMQSYRFNNSIFSLCCAQPPSQIHFIHLPITGETAMQTAMPFSPTLLTG